MQEAAPRVGAGAWGGMAGSEVTVRAGRTYMGLLEAELGQVQFLQRGQPSWVTVTVFPVTIGPAWRSRDWFYINLIQ